jgi:hypothetical protein
MRDIEHMRRQPTHEASFLLRMMVPHRLEVKHLVYSVAKEFQHHL